MRKLKQFDEYEFLNLFHQEMLEKGRARHLVRLSLNARVVEQIYDNSGVSVTEKDLQKIADVCLANGWLEHADMTDQYENLQLTTIGLGVVKSKQKQAEQLNNRSIFKKTSDYIEEHKGLLMLLGFIIALVGLLIKFYGGTDNG